MEPTTPTTAERHNDGKLQWSLVDFAALEDMVRVLMFGAKKYSPHGWKDGQKTTDIADCLLRHLTAYLAGEDTDPESGLPHTAHILCNGMFLAHMDKFRRDMDSRHLSALNKAAQNGWPPSAITGWQRLKEPGLPATVEKTLEEKAFEMVTPKGWNKPSDLPPNLNDIRILTKSGEIRGYYSKNYNDWKEYSAAGYTVIPTEDVLGWLPQ